MAVVGRVAVLGDQGVNVVPVFFARPEGDAVRLRIQPRLACWNAAGHPDQVRLAEFLDHAESVLKPTLERLSEPVALRLDVGLPDVVSVLDGRDLDNFAYPLAARLARSCGLVLSSM